jgi:integrase
MSSSRKSANGNGTLRKRPNGLWEWQITLHYVDGTTERKSVYGTTQAETKRKGEQLHIQAGTIKQSPHTTVADLVQMFYVDAERRLTNNTIRQYKYVFDNYLVPQFGTLKLSAVKVSTIDTLIDRARSQGYGNEDQRKAFKEHGTPIPPLGANSLAILRRCTRALFSKAVEWELISKNPVTRSQTVKVERKLSQGMTPEQSQEYLKAFVTSPTAYPLAFALGTGIRIAECLGIKHTDIEERSGKFYLNLSQQLLIENEHPVLRPLKTQNSKRIIPLNNTMVDIVTKQKIIQARLGAKGNLGLLFTTTVGTPVNVNNLRRWMRTQLPKFGLDVITPHDLRRGFVSVLVAANADIKTISALLGHADISTTLNIYAQANTKKKEEVMAQMELLLLGGEKSSSE